MRFFNLNPAKKSEISSGASKGISTSVGILVIVIFALLAVGILSWQWSDLKKVEMPEIKAPEEILPPLPPGEEIPPEEETADWKVYRNEEYGFEVRYPGGWSINLSPNEVRIGNDTQKVFIQIDHERSQFVKEEWLPQESKAINNFTFVIKSYGDVLGIAHVLFIEKDGHAFIIQTVPDFTFKDSDLVNSILSTLRFIK